MKKLVLLVLSSMFLVGCGNESSITSESINPSSTEPISEPISEPTSDSPTETSEEPPEPVDDGLFYEKDILNFNEKYIVQKVDNGYSTAIATWCANYEDNGVKLVADVIDSDLNSPSDIGYGDNVEIQIQAYNSTFQLENYTVNFASSFNGGYWLNKWGNGSYKSFVPAEEDFSFKHEKTSDGWKAEVYISFNALNVNKADALGKVRVFFAMRNCSSGTANVYEEYNHLGSSYSTPNTWWVLSKDNNFIRDDFDSFKFGNNESDIFGNLAQLETTLKHYNTEPGAPAFLLSNVCLNTFGLADELLENSSYIRGNKTSTRATAKNSGYVIAAANDLNEQINQQLNDSNWTLLREKCPDILTVIANNSHDFNQLVNYYYKYVEKDESISIDGQWCILFGAKDINLPQFYWDYEPGYLTADISDSFYEEDAQEFTCGPNMALTEKGRLFTVIQSGGSYEPLTENYFLIYYSDDNGKNWVRAGALDSWVDQKPGTTKRVCMLDGCIAINDINELIFFYSLREDMDGGQTVGMNTFMLKVSNPDDDPREWNVTQNKKVFDRVLTKNKFIILKDGTYLFAGQYCPDERYTAIYSSNDKGNNWELKKLAYIPQANSYDEPIMLQKQNGDIWMGLRSRTGRIVVSISKDNGLTWSIGEKSVLPNPNSRFNAGILPSGEWYLIFNNNEVERKNMSISISKDEGKTWSKKVILYDRFCSYPDSVIIGDTLHLAFDDGRYEQYAWRTDKDGSKTWGYIYHYAISIEKLLNDYTNVNIEDFDVLTKCKLLTLDQIEGDGSESNPYQITSLTSFNVLAKYSQTETNFVGKHIKLMNDISGVNIKFATNTNPFAGHFDGNGHSITVNYSHGSGVANQGLFGHTDSTSLIENLTVKGTMVTTQGNETHMGMLIGISEGIVKNCTNYGTMEAAGYQVGGLIGRMVGGTVEDCKNYGKVSSTSAVTGNSTRGVAGVVGCLTNTKKCVVKNCNNYADITTSTTQVGGVVGSSNGTSEMFHEITGCLNEGAISCSAVVNNTSNEGTGGIVGFSLYTNISSCVNNGNVTAIKSSQVAGIAGKLADSTCIDACINNGTIIGYNQVGGIGGRFVGNATIKNSTNNGIIKYVEGTKHGQIFGHNGGCTLIDNIENGSIEQYIEE